jgi:glucokinase
LVSIGIDVGGSGIRGATLFEGKLGPLQRAPLPDRSPETVVEAISALVTALGEADHLGVALPGFLSEGVVYGSPNFPGWSQVPIRSLLSESTGFDVVLENDANAAALGVWEKRGSREDLVLLTLGTGVGGGVVSGGQLLRGTAGLGGELGHIFVGGERACGCGGKGCLETWICDAGLVAASMEQGKNPENGLAVVDAARAGERWAALVLQNAAKALGRGVVSLVNLFNPDVVILAGGLTQERDLFSPVVEQTLRDNGIPPSVDKVTLFWEGPADALAVRGVAALASGLSSATS